MSVPLTLSRSEGGVRLFSDRPPRPSGWIPRPRLEQALTVASHSRLTAVIGPPGSGKTGLLSSWAEIGSTPMVAWSELTQLDNDPACFIRHLEVAGRLADPWLGSVLSQILGERDCRSGHCGSFANVPGGPYVLALDDVEVITTHEVLDSIEHLVRCLPAEIHVVMAGRWLPNLPLAHLRSSGQYQEIDEEALQFNVDEAEALFLAARNRPLPREEVRALIERTEGWAAGLRLASLMLVGLDEDALLSPHLTGEVELVAEYFTREVIANLPGPFREFLVQTSVLDELTPDVCRAVTGRLDAVEILEELARRHLFIVPLDVQKRTYRYQRLFLEFLRGIVWRKAPLIGRAAHARAASWFISQGDHGSAVRNLVDAGQYEAAFALGVKSIIGRLDERAPFDKQESVVSMVPDDYLEADPFRLCVLATELLWDVRLFEAARCIRAIERTSRFHPQHELLLGQAELLWTIRDGLLSDPDGVLLHYGLAAERFTFERASVLHGAQTYPQWLGAMDAALVANVRPFAVDAQLWRGDTQAAIAVLRDQMPAETLSDHPSYQAVLARSA